MTRIRATNRGIRSTIECHGDRSAVYGRDGSGSHKTQLGRALRREGLILCEVSALKTGKTPCYLLYLALRALSRRGMHDGLKKENPVEEPAQGAERGAKSRGAGEIVLVGNGYATHVFLWRGAWRSARRGY